MSTISGRHFEKPSTSTYVRHLQVFSIDIDIFGHFWTFCALGIIFGCLTFTFLDIFCPGHHLGVLNIDIFCHMFSTFPATFAGNPVDLRHRNLQTSESTSVYTLTGNGGFWPYDFPKKISLEFHILIKKCPIVAAKRVWHSVCSGAQVPWQVYMITAALRD